MKKILIGAVAVGLTAVSVPIFAAEQTVSMDIERMNCALCPITVRKAMEQVDGVVHVEVDFDNKTATVTFEDSKTTASAVAQASTDVGYPAKPVVDPETH